MLTGCAVAFSLGRTALDPFDLNAAILQQGNDCPDRRDDWREDGADDTCRQRKFRNRPATVLNDHPTNIALVNQRPKLFDEVVAFGFEGLPESLLAHMHRSFALNALAG